MKTLGYWGACQLIVGIWLLFSPFLLGFTGMKAATFNDMIVGSLVVILGLAVSLLALYDREDLDREFHEGMWMRKP
jgi:hypothetical protein